MNAASRPRLTVPRKFFRKYLPDAAAVRSNRLVAMFSGFLGHPNLWHLNRRSASRAVGIGLFSGLVPGPLQMLCALLLAIPMRANLPVALVLTLYTNPLTIVPLYLLAYAYGKLLLRAEHVEVKVETFVMDWTNVLQSLHGLLDWCIALGKPLAVGLVALALTLGIAGALVTRLAWRFYAVAAWRRRASRRAGPA